MQDTLDRGREVSYVEVRRRRPGRVLLAVLLIVAALAVVAFFAFGGGVDVEDKGGVDVKPPTVEVQKPDVDVQGNGS